MNDADQSMILSSLAARFAGPPVVAFDTPVATSGAGRDEMLRSTEKAEAVGHLAGGLAHDLNNLLGVILGNLDRASRLLPSDTNGSRCVADALTATDRAVALVSRLLAFVRRQPLVPQVVEVDRLLLGLRPLLEIAAPGCAIVLDLDCAWRSLVDANQLENAILNLAVNARDAMSGGGRVTIVTRTLSIRVDGDDAPGLDRDYVVLEVRDTGTGMTPEVLDKALEPFFTTKAAGLGSGLGLSQVFGFATQCGGAMNLASVIGEGTSVTLRIPRATIGTHAGPPPT